MSTGAAPRGVLLVADDVVTLSTEPTRPRAVLVRGSRIVWLGADPGLAPPHRARLDLPGCVIGPGFVDAHVHLTTTGLALDGLDLAGLTRTDEVLEQVAAHAAAHPGRVIWGQGLDPQRLQDPLPTPDQLARVAAGRAVYLTQVDGHAGLVDRGTLHSAPLARAEGVDRDHTGSPTGRLRREANHIARRWAVGAMSGAQLQTARRRAVARAAGLGIASLHEMGGPDQMGGDDLDVWIEDDWPVEIVPYWAGWDLEEAVARNLRHAGGDVLLDGSLGAHTAALSEPYHDRPQASGHLELDDDSLTEWLLAGTRAGLQLGVHAIGDAALRQLITSLRAVESRLAGERRPDAVRRLRHRVEHGVVVPPELSAPLAELGVVVSGQPAFEIRFGGETGLYASRLGPRRQGWTNPFRQLLDAGVPLAFGSDSAENPLDPWAAVHAASAPQRGVRAITREEALRLATLGGRYAARQERYVGVLRPGMRADLAAFADDPYRSPDPRGTHAVLTLVHGRVAHGDAPLPDAPGRCP